MFWEERTSMFKDMPMQHLNVLKKKPYITYSGLAHLHPNAGI
jgi:hypothetical protein